jgi:hypothetical protein
MPEIDLTQAMQQQAPHKTKDVLAATAKLMLSTRLDLIGANAQVGRLVYRGTPATIDSIDSALDLALATGDATITASINAVAVTGGLVTIAQVASAAGDLDQAVPTALNVVTDGQVIELTVGGTNTAAAFADVTLALTYEAV